MKQQNYKYMVATQCMTYNHSLYIQETLHGFTIQETTFPIVFCIIDDASTDGEQDVIKQYLADNFNVPYREKETDDYQLICAKHKTNLTCTFVVFLLKYNHHSIKKIKMPYISEWHDNAKYHAICEGDDYWIHPQKLQRQVQFLERNGNYVMIYSQAKVLEKEKIVGLIGSKTCDFESIAKHNGITTLTTLFRHDLFKKYNNEFKPFAPKNWKMSDYPLWLYFSLNGKICYIDEPFGVYRKLAESASHSSNIQKSLDFAENICQIRLYFIQYVEKITGLNKSKLRKKVLKENVMRVLAVYLSFHKIKEAKKYLNDNRDNLSFFTIQLIKLRIIKQILHMALESNEESL